MSDSPSTVTDLKKAFLHATIYQALKNENIARVDVCLAKGINIDETCSVTLGQSTFEVPFLQAALLNGGTTSVAFVGNLLARGASVHLPDANGYTPLLGYLARNPEPRIDIVNRLLLAGADPAYQTPSGVDAFQIAQHIDDIKQRDAINQALLNKALNPNPSASSLPAHILPYAEEKLNGDMIQACGRADLNVVDKNLSLWSDINKQLQWTVNGVVENFFHTAIFRELNFPFIKELVVRGADIDLPSSKGETPLLRYIAKVLEKPREEAGDSTNSSFSENFQILNWKNHKEVIDGFLRLGANLFAQNADGENVFTLLEKRERKLGSDARKDVILKGVREIVLMNIPDDTPKQSPDVSIESMSSTQAIVVSGKPLLHAPKAGS